MNTPLTTCRTCGLKHPGSACPECHPAAYTSAPPLTLASIRAESNYRTHRTILDLVCSFTFVGLILVGLSGGFMVACLSGATLVIFRLIFLLLVDIADCQVRQAIRASRF